MNPASLIPVADSLTAHWGWFQFLLMLTFPLHLLAMNALLGSALTAFIAHLMPGRPYRDLAYALAKALPFLVAFTVNLGVAPLLFVNVIYGHLLYTSTVLMGLYWLAVIPILIIAYYLTYIYDFSFKRLGNLAMFAVLAVLVLVMVVGFFFTNNMTLMLTPDSWNRWFSTPGGSLLNLSDPALLPRYLHMMTGSLAVGGLCVALYAQTVLTQDNAVSDAGVKLGMGLFSWLTALQLFVGAWFLLTLPTAVLKRFMGGDPIATVLLLAGILLAVASLVSGFKRKVVASLSLAIPLLYVMSFIRDIVRSGYLAPFFDPAKVPVTPQWSPMVLFFVSLVGGIALVAWMLAQLPAAQKADPVD